MIPCHLDSAAEAATDSLDAALVEAEAVSDSERAEAAGGSASEVAHPRGLMSAGEEEAFPGAPTIGTHPQHPMTKSHIPHTQLLRPQVK